MSTNSAYLGLGALVTQDATATASTAAAAALPPFTDYTHEFDFLSEPSVSTQ
jgi:hypothetical protein